MESKMAGGVAGSVVSFVPVKACGFIKGEDGKHYFFHRDDVEGQITLMAGQIVTFEPCSSPEGSKAKCVLPRPGPIPIYVDPHNFVWSEYGPPRGMRRVLIIGSGRSRSRDPYEARRLLIEAAKKSGANAVLQASLSKYTEEEACSNYRYTMHRFDAQFAVVKVIRTTSDPLLIADSQAQMRVLQDWWAKQNTHHSKRDRYQPPSAKRLIPPGTFKRVLGLCWGWIRTTGKIRGLAALFYWEKVRAYYQARKRDENND